MLTDYKEENAKVPRYAQRHLIDAKLLK